LVVKEFLDVFLSKQSDALGHHGFFAADDSYFFACLAFEAYLLGVDTEDLGDALLQ
jgi:hypothetical protein